MEKNITIEPAGTAIDKAVTIDKICSNFLVRIISLFFWLAGVASVIYILLNYTMPGFLGSSDLILGLFVLVLAKFLVYLAGRSFYLQRLKKTPAGMLNNIKSKLSQNQPANLFEVFSFDLAKATSALFSDKDPATVSLRELGQSLLLAEDMAFIVFRLGLNRDSVINALEDKKDVTGIILAAVDVAIVNNHTSIWSGDLFLSICQSSDGLNKLFADYRLEPVDLKSLVSWQTKVMAEIDLRVGLFNKNKFKFTGGVGKDWSYGYTLFLRQFSIDLTASIADFGLGLEIIGREKEIKEIEDALSRSANANVILVGNAGVGKHTTILGFAKKVIDGEVQREITHDDILQIDTEALISGVTSEGEIIERFRTCLQEAVTAGNIIILIENIDNLFSANGVGTANLTAILLPFLENSAIHIIGTSEVTSYNEYIVGNTSLANHFVRVSMSEPTGENLVKILEDTAPVIESRAGSIITFEAIKATIHDAAKYLVNLTEPERSINLLEGAVMKATSLRGKTIITESDVADYVAEKFQLPAAEAGEAEKTKLLNLEKIMHETVIGQNEAVMAVSNAMRRARSQVSNLPKPIGSFLFLGPTGVGKTATAKALARAYFGNATNMIRFDMSEYQNKADIYRLIGTKEEAGNLTTFVSEKPFSLLLFDEIEKADPDILNLFLQILDEGMLTDGRGQKISFNNTIIIATSNAGSELISQTLNQRADYEQIKNNLNQYLIDQHIFKPELLNRFSGVIAFSPLDLPAIREVAKLLIANLKATVLANKEIRIEIADDAVAYLAELGFDPKMGARSMERVIADKIENLLADKILRNEIKKGDQFIISREMLN
ncbi:MAG TPA: ATP-dependent Clp protease ATP-binding subunit [Patescibacteria group bacterium]|nr:ATP-dependent Clp protease ATP-binding subunit [Patescibacteria group bacterium]